MPNDSATMPRPSLGAIVPNAGPPAPMPYAAAHQSPLPWVNLVTMWPVLRSEQAERN